MISKVVLRALEVGRLTRDLFIEMKVTHFSLRGNFPRIFPVWFSQVFDVNGYVREDASPSAIKAIRQFCDYFYKTAFAFKKEEIRNAVEAYTGLERELEQWSPKPAWSEAMRKNAENLYKGIFKASPDHVLATAPPRDGPGTFVGSNRVAKWAAYKKSIACSWIYPTGFEPYSGLFRPYRGSRGSRKVMHSKPSAEVLFVPKDSRGPRVISREALPLLRAQMSFFDWASTQLERDTSYRINFASQQINRDLACIGSMDRSWTTGDLKDASDRVTIRLVRKVFRNSPAVMFFLKHARSESFSISHEALDRPITGTLNKLGGMGSGLTFVLLACVVHCSIVTAIRQDHGLPLKRAAQLVYVYGDDVVVPSEYWESAQRGLSESGLLVNTSKSYSNGFFRESCGGDYFRGTDVTPVRLRLSNAELGEPPKVPLLNIRSDNGILQVERHCRELVKAGLHVLANEWYKLLEKSLGELPSVSGISPVLGRWDERSYAQTDTLGFVPTPVRFKTDTMCPYQHLSSFFKSTWGSDTMPYGELISPRKVKLNRRVVSDQDLSGIELSKEFPLYAPSKGGVQCPSWLYELSKALVMINQAQATRTV
jgi:hypothetical protein